MKRFLHLDEEQADLLRISAESMAAALHARARRVDEGGHLANSAKMGEIKMASVLRKLHEPAPYKYSELPFDDKVRAIQLMGVLLDHDRQDQYDAAWEALVAIIVLRPDPNEAPFDIDHEHLTDV